MRILRDGVTTTYRCSREPLKGVWGTMRLNIVQTLLPQKLRLSACPCPVLGGHLAISNRAHLTADLSAELLAQQVVLSNEHGYTDTSAWLHTEVITDSHNSPSPLKHLFFRFYGEGGLAVCLAFSTGSVDFGLPESK